MFSNKPTKRVLHFVAKENGVPILTLREDENEYIIKKYVDTELGFNSTVAHGNGDLYVTSLRIVWLSKTEDKPSYEFDVPYIMLHAISKDTSTYPKPCIYCQLDEEIIETEEEDDADAEPTECFFAPLEEELLMSMFEDFSQAAQLNPDADEEEGNEDGMIQYSTDDFIFNQEEVAAGVQQAQLEEWDKKFIDPSQPVNQFQDSKAHADELITENEDEHTGKYIKTA